MSHTDIWTDVYTHENCTKTRQISRQIFFLSHRRTGWTVVSRTPIHMTVLTVLETVVITPDLLVLLHLNPFFHVSVSFLQNREDVKWKWLYHTFEFGKYTKFLFSGWYKKNTLLCTRTCCRTNRSCVWTTDSPLFPSTVSWPRSRWRIPIQGSQNFIHYVLIAGVGTSRRGMSSSLIVCLCYCHSKKKG